MDKFLVGLVMLLLSSVSLSAPFEGRVWFSSFTDKVRLSWEASNADSYNVTVVDYLGKKPPIKTRGITAPTHIVIFPSVGHWYLCVSSVLGGVESEVRCTVNSASNQSNKQEIIYIRVSTPTNVIFE